MLTVQGYAPSSATIVTSQDVNVTLRGLTIRNGASRQGGGIYNLGTLSVSNSTVAENAAYNKDAAYAMGGGIYNAGDLTLQRSTVSGNQSEYYGGALYNAGPQLGVAPVAVNIIASTIAENRANRLPDQKVVAVTDGGMSPNALTVTSGDEIRFENRTANVHTLNVTVGAGGACQSSQVTVPVIGNGLSSALICTKSGTSGSVLVTVTDSLNGGISLQITVQAVAFTPAAHAIYRAGNSRITLTRSILFSSLGSGQSCDRPGSDTYAVIISGGYNQISDANCLPDRQPNDMQVGQAEVAKLGPLQDNNIIDFAGNWVSGYTYSHALSPSSTAIDQIPPESCGSAAVGRVELQEPFSGLGLRINAGEVIQWRNRQTYPITLAFHDGESAVQLVEVPANGFSRQVQFTTPGDQAYTVYNAASRVGLGSGTVTVQPTVRLADQRGMALPQRGPQGQYNCDIGAYEFAAWIVGQPLPRPPAAIGTQAPTWAINNASVEDQAYHAWSPATALDYALRPSRVGLEVKVKWNRSMDPAAALDLFQTGVVEWPEAPQIHVSGAPVNLGHNQVSDSFLTTGARAFEGTEPADDLAGAILSQRVFTRTALTAIPGDSYSVLQLAKGSQTNATLKVVVVKTMDWNTAGVRDMTAQRAACTIGSTLSYPLHRDPEGKAGYILAGDAYDGVRTQADLAVVQNTVANALAPSHVRETRAGPIIPVLATAPTAFANTDPATGGHDLRVAWYLLDSRNVAWPVRTVGYRCDWPPDAPQIVIASELGSEIGGQTVLTPDRFGTPAVYHQADTGQPGYSPNYEHALLAASNLGNTAPTFYALRTDLFDRDNTGAARSFALLKYLDPAEDNAPKMAAYQVVLTRAAQTIPVSAATPRTGIGDLPTGDRFTVPIELLGVQNLRSATIQVTFDPAVLTPATCAVNRQDWMERPIELTLASDAPARPGAVVHLRASLVAGTDVSYQWNFGDGTVQIDRANVSHVYGAPGNYTVIVTATNGLFATLITANTVVNVADGVTPGTLPAASATGCRIGSEATLTLEVMARNKHGLSGDLTLADVTFTRQGTSQGSLTPQVVSLAGPGYESLAFDITAGNPVYAPTPMRGLLDVQPCAQTQAADLTALPFWKDYRNMLWARAAGDMEVLYFYPLQNGFYLSASQARELGLTDAKTGQALSPDKRVGRCVPWLNKLTTGTRPYPDFPTVGSSTQVLPVAYHVSWPALSPLLSVGETVYERPKAGVSGVATQLAVSRIYDDLAPGVWNNTQKKIVLNGAQTIKSLTQLIAPVAEVRLPVNIKINGNFSLPEEIKTERRLFGGGLAVVGNKNDINLNLPFSLRSRISYDDTTGELVFRGYYDGASPEYIKGDPLLLLNVMASSDVARLQALCPGGGNAYPYDSTNCGKYKKAVKDLYWKTLNPRQLDLCRDASGRLAPGDPEPAVNQLAKTSAMKACDATYYRDGQPDQAFLIGVQDANNDGIPEPYEGLGKGKALTAGNAAGTGYVTLAYNNDESLGGLPVSLQVIKVGCEVNAQGDDSTYRGNLLVIKSDNLFDEKLTLRHTGDFGGRPDKFTFDWYIAAVDDTGVSPAVAPPAYPWRQWTKIEPGASQVGAEITIEGANPTTLSDNWLIMRYKGYAACGNAYRYSAFAGDPSAKPSEVRGQLAEGWIKRVTSALNPFDARVDDFVSSPVNTTVSMIQQAGPRYEGPVAMSNDPETLNKMGLIEAYQTVLNRGRSLSIDSNINDQGANAALLNVTSRIADLYMLLANDAYADALDPTVALGTASSLGNRAGSAFAFMNQFPATQFGLIDEELALLRGRDQTLGGVAAGPTYNRLTWNFTHGEGAVAYQQNYNVKDMNGDGFINEADAALMYPQGHGDAWGQFLTALTKYYELLRHPNYTWVPRAEPVAVAGAPVVVDYYDERRFAIAAANKARIGAEIVDLSYRKHYADPASQAYVDTYVDATDTCMQQASADCQQRAWGVADWAERAGQGALFDWVVANAILPAEDDRYTDLRKIDRTTVAEIGEIAGQYAAIQTKLDNADRGANPLGLAPDAVLFDLDPAATKTTAGQEGQTHFEQTYERALSSLGNAVALFDYANQMKIALRDSQNSQMDFAHQVVDEDRALVNELIDLFGTPYADDIGVNGTYPAGYAGPDIYNYDLTDRTTMTDFQKRCTDDEIRNGRCSQETKTYTVWYKALDCIGQYVSYKTVDDVRKGENFCGDKLASTVGVAHIVGTGLDAGYGRFTPATWSGSRRVSGLIPNNLQTVYSARANYELALTQYQNLIDAMTQAEAGIRDRAEVLRLERNRQIAYVSVANTLRGIVLVLKEIALGMKQGDKQARAFSDAADECIPTVVGMAVDATAPARCSILFAGYGAAGIMSGIEIAAQVSADAVDFGLTLGDDILQLQNLETEQDYELRQMGRDFLDLLRQEKELRIQVLLAKNDVDNAQSDYLNAVQLGFRKLKELSVKRQQWAGQISEQRYGDMAYRTFQTDALQKYRQQFDLAQLYTFLTAAAYDYETNLAGSDPANGGQFVRGIANLRSLGDVRVTPDGTAMPIAGAAGLADPLARMNANFTVLKGQMGFNNPQSEASRFSLRSELFRLRDTSDAKWRQTLQRYYTPDIFSNDDVARLAKRPYGETGREPGLVIPFGSTVTRRLNFFGKPLGAGDSSYSATQFATKIASVGVWFEGYDTSRLAQTPRVYLLPAGKDVIRPRDTSGQLRYWNITEQLLPLPYPITRADMQNPDWLARVNGLNGQLFASKPYADMRAYPYSDDLSPDELNTDTRLIGRSVWNTEWILVIPGATLLGDPEVGIERFIQGVDDIYIYFQTYAYAGTAAAAQAEAQVKAEAKAETAATLTLASSSASPSPLALPDALLYGVALRNSELLTSGSVKAILPRGAVVNVDVTPITGTNYSYALAVPLSQYLPDLGIYAADSARPDETIRFLVNDTPAAFRAANGALTDQFMIPTNGPGQAYRLDPALTSPENYPLGDVNANGVRNSADALLILKYDVGLIAGDTNFPPGLGQIYLPLCDIAPDGRCNSSDALRILQCDVQMPGVSCPNRPASAAHSLTQPSQDPHAPAFHVEISRTVATEAAAERIMVRVRGGDDRAVLSAAALRLDYPADRLLLESCAIAAAGLDGGYCNTAFGPGQARLAVLATAGIHSEQALAELTFRPRAGASNDADLRTAFALAVAGVFDGAGKDLGWRVLAPQLAPRPGSPQRVYLPLVLNGVARQGDAQPIEGLKRPTYLPFVLHR